MLITRLSINGDHLVYLASTLQNKLALTYIIHPRVSVLFLVLFSEINRTCILSKPHVHFYTTCYSRNVELLAVIEWDIMLMSLLFLEMMPQILLFQKRIQQRRAVTPTSSHMGNSHINKNATRNFNVK